MTLFDEIDEAFIVEATASDIWKSMQKCARPDMIHVGAGIWLKDGKPSEDTMDMWGK